MNKGISCRHRSCMKQLPVSLLGPRKHATLTATSRSSSWTAGGRELVSWIIGRRRKRVVRTDDHILRRTPTITPPTVRLCGWPSFADHACSLHRSRCCRGAAARHRRYTRHRKYVSRNNAPACEEHQPFLCSAVLTLVRIFSVRALFFSVEQ